MNNNELKLPDQELVSKFRSLIPENEYQVSDELLLCFIRAKKNDLQCALKLFKNYLKLVKNYPDICKDLQVEPLLDLFNSKIFSALPDRDQHGRRILIFDAYEWGNRVINMDAAVRGILLGLQMIASDPKNQINGIVLIFDVKDLKLHQVRQITPSFLAKMTILFEDAFPIVVKGAHVLHEPLVLKIIVAMMWPFMSDEIRSRVFFHGKSLKSLHQHIDPSYLPKSFGGKECIDNVDFLSVYKDKHPNIFHCFN